MNFTVNGTDKIVSKLFNVMHKDAPSTLLVHVTNKGTNLISGSQRFMFLR